MTALSMATVLLFLASVTRLGPPRLLVVAAAASANRSLGMSPQRRHGRRRIACEERQVLRTGVVAVFVDAPRGANSAFVVSEHSEAAFREETREPVHSALGPITVN
jgi:NADH:ubiquinone oxidoreductase subunit D